MRFLCLFSILLFSFSARGYADCHFTDVSQNEMQCEDGKSYVRGPDGTFRSKEMTSEIETPDRQSEIARNENAGEGEQCKFRTGTNQEIFDCPDGAVYQRHSDGAYRRVANVNPVPPNAVSPTGSPFSNFDPDAENGVAVPPYNAPAVQSGNASGVAPFRPLVASPGTQAPSAHSAEEENLPGGDVPAFQPNGVRPIAPPRLTPDAPTAEIADAIQKIPTRERSTPFNSAMEAPDPAIFESGAASSFRTRIYPTVLVKKGDGTMGYAVKPDDRARDCSLTPTYASAPRPGEVPYCIFISAGHCAPRTYDSESVGVVYSPASRQLVPLQFFRHPNFSLVRKDMGPNQPPADTVNNDVMLAALRGEACSEFINSHPPIPLCGELPEAGKNMPPIWVSSAKHSKRDIPVSTTAKVSFDPNRGVIETTVPPKLLGPGDSGGIVFTRAKDPITHEDSKCALGVLSAGTASTTGIDIQSGAPVGNWARTQIEQIKQALGKPSFATPLLNLGAIQ